MNLNNQDSQIEEQQQIEAGSNDETHSPSTFTRKTRQTRSFSTNQRTSVTASPMSSSPGVASFSDPNMNPNSRPNWPISSSPKISSPSNFVSSFVNGIAHVLLPKLPYSPVSKVRKMFKSRPAAYTPTTSHAQPAFNGDSSKRRSPLHSPVEKKDNKNYSDDFVNNSDSQSSTKKSSSRTSPSSNSTLNKQVPFSTPPQFPSDAQKEELILSNVVSRYESPKSDDKILKSLHQQSEDCKFDKIPSDQIEGFGGRKNKKGLTLNISNSTESSVSSSDVSPDDKSKTLSKNTKSSNKFTLKLFDPQEYPLTCPPALDKGVIVKGTSCGDNKRTVGVPLMAPKTFESNLSPIPHNKNKTSEFSFSSFKKTVLPGIVLPHLDAMEEKIAKVNTEGIPKEKHRRLARNFDEEDDSEDEDGRVPQMGQLDPSFRRDIEDDQYQKNLSLKAILSPYGGYQAQRAKEINENPFGLRNSQNKEDKDKKRSAKAQILNLNEVPPNIDMNELLGGTPRPTGLRSKNPEEDLIDSEKKTEIKDELVREFDDESLGGIQNDDYDSTEEIPFDMDDLLRKGRNTHSGGEEENAKQSEPFKLEKDKFSKLLPSLSKDRINSVFKPLQSRRFLDVIRAKATNQEQSEKAVVELYEKIRKLRGIAALQFKPVQDEIDQSPILQGDDEVKKLLTSLNEYKFGSTDSSYFGDDNELINVIKEFLVRISGNNPDFLNVFTDAILFDYGNQDFMNDEFIYKNAVSGFVNSAEQSSDQEKAPNYWELNKQQYSFKKLRRIEKTVKTLKKLERDCELCMNDGEFFGQFQL